MYRIDSKETISCTDQTESGKQQVYYKCINIYFWQNLTNSWLWNYVFSFEGKFVKSFAGYWKYSEKAGHGCSQVIHRLFLKWLQICYHLRYWTDYHYYHYLYHSYHYPNKRKRKKLSEKNESPRRKNILQSPMQDH